MSRLLLAATLLATVTASAGAATGDPDAWKNPLPEQPAALVVRDATIWTSGARGRLEHADLLVEKGKIVAVGPHLEAPAGCLEISAAGRQVTPGLIDAHSHMAIAGGVNEATHISTAEVRIGDVIDADSINIYWQLAGGLTIANLLHGSANAIGGQNAVIKLRWGQPPAALLVGTAHPGIKFALGENPKQSNWNVAERRYPQTRMGIDDVIRARFRAALDYRRAWQRYRAAKDPDLVPPRRDLELEALVEVLEGKRDIHSHSYRADEILMLMRIAEQFGIRVKTFQHGLEAYKVAAEIARHGAGVSTFSDWWAYKYEVIDAIPYNGAILERHGVVTSFNSDDEELARRLNVEAAKAVRYGGLSEQEALRLVTLNPAIQLGIDDRVGSLEPGKDADFVLWSGDPLSTYSRCEETWVDGRKYFDRDEDLERRRAVAAEREALLAKARARAEKSNPDSEETGPAPTPAPSPIPPPPSHLRPRASGGQGAP